MGINKFRELNDGTPLPHRHTLKQWFQRNQRIFFRWRRRRNQPTLHHDLDSADTAGHGPHMYGVVTDKQFNTELRDRERAGCCRIDQCKGQRTVTATDDNPCWFQLTT